MNFGQALELLKQGGRVARKGWNGKNMYIFLGTCSPNEITGSDLTLTSPDCKFICMKAADGSLVVGWLASQTDMLSEDWEAVG